MNLREEEEKCREFLHELAAGMEETSRLIVSYPDEATVQVDENGKKLNSGFWPQPYKDGKYIKTESNAYVCISSSIKTENPKTGEMRYWRGEASFSSGQCFFIDDVGNGKGSKGEFILEELEAQLPPTAVVETSPNNYQLWYFFDKPVTKMRYFKAFLHQFVANVLENAGGDVTIKDVARYGRMPIGINNKRLEDGSLKYKCEDGKPFRVHLVKADYSKRYSPDTIAEAFGFAVHVEERKIGNVDKAELAIDNYWLKMAQRILNRTKQGEGTGGEVVANQSGKFRIRCPWGHEHTNGDPYGAYFRGPVPGADFDFVFGCGHDTCRKENKRTWSLFVDEVVMPHIIGSLEMANLEVEAWEKFMKDYWDDDETDE